MSEISDYSRKMFLIIGCIYTLTSISVSASETKEQLSGEYQNRLADIDKLFEQETPLPSHQVIDLGKEALELFDFVKNDNLELKIFYRMAVEYTRLNDYHNARKYSELLHQHATQMNNRGRLSDALNLLGLISYYQSDYASSLEYLQQSYILRKELNDESKLSDSFNNFGMVYRKLGLFEDALDVYEKSLAIRKRLDDQSKIASSINNIGIIYRNMELYDEALINYSKALNMKEHFNEPRDMGAILNNIGFAYHNLDQISLALENFEKSLVYKKLTRDTVGEIKTIFNIGTAYSKLGQLEKASAFIEEGMLKANASQSESLILLGLLRTTEISLLRKSFSETEKNAKKAIQLASQLGEIPKLSGAYSLLSLNYEAQGKMKEALKYHQLFKSVSDSLLKTERQQRLADLERRIALNEQLKEVEFLRRQYALQSEVINTQTNRRNWIIAVFLLTLLLVIMIFRRIQHKQVNRRLKNKVLEHTKSISILAEVGLKITSQLELNRVYDILYKNIKELIPIDSFGVGLYEKGNDFIEYPYAIANGKHYKPYTREYTDKRQFSVYCIEKNKVVFIREIERDAAKYIKQHEYLLEHENLPSGELSNGEKSLKPRSLIYVPLELEAPCHGLITVESWTENNFTSQHLDILRALAGYTSTAITNARNLAQIQLAKNELEQAYKKLETVSLTEPLTGLNNRRFLFKHIEPDIRKSLRDYKKWNDQVETRQPFTSDIIFLILDLDHFKNINDIFGHEAGDMVLIKIKDILKEVCRESDYCVRWGGEEFLVVARFVDRKEAPMLAERIRQAVESHSINIGKAKRINTTCSIGYASFPFLRLQPDLVGWRDVIKIADNHLYLAKRLQRNAWVGVSFIDKVYTTIDLKNILHNPHLLIESKYSTIESSIKNIEELYRNKKSPR